jgi:kynureninase
MRPVLTGWFAEFEELAAERAEAPVPYASGGARFAGSTYDPTSHYRAARVFTFFEERGLSPEFLRTVYLHQTRLLARCFDQLDAPEQLLKRERAVPLDHFGGFLAIECAQSTALAERLADAGVLTDARGRYLRLGPAPYLSDAQLEAAMERLGNAVSVLSASR